MKLNDIHLGPTKVMVEKGGAFICDIDGTIADCSHRQHYVRSKPKNWPAFEAGIPFDTPILPVVSLVHDLVGKGMTLLMCSGRSEKNRDETVQWLDRLKLKPEVLLMRKNRDFRADNLVKSDMLNELFGLGYSPSFTLDDRNQVVQMWRDRGITCIQVAEGDF